MDINALNYLNTVENVHAVSDELGKEYQVFLNVTLLFLKCIGICALTCSNEVSGA